jgi:hypothetical protein
MTRIEPSGVATRPVSPTGKYPQVLCLAMHCSDGVPTFVFQTTGVRTQFTVHAPAEDSYRVGTPYQLLLAPADSLPLPLTVADIEYLRHCLRNAANRWREAIAEADAGATRPQHPSPAQSGCLNVEPTSAGYRHARRWFADELDRVEHLGRLLDQHLDHAGPMEEDGDQP